MILKRHSFIDCSHSLTNCCGVRGIKHFGTFCYSHHFLADYAPVAVHPTVFDFLHNIVCLGCNFECTAHKYHYASDHITVIRLTILFVPLLLLQF